MAHTGSLTRFTAGFGPVGSKIRLHSMHRFGIVAYLFGSCMNLWLFADLRGIPSLGNSALDMVLERLTSGWILPSDIRYTYDNTMAKSKLRALIIHWYWINTTPEGLRSYCIDPPVNFLHDVYPLLAKRPNKLKSRAAMTEVDRCRWHNHSGTGGKLRLESRKRRKMDCVNEKVRLYL